ncbi:MAG: hypothetical protein GY809_33120 [Planctomycetes bacterium]|nr:hypothetical protein [Planctomycetota bacterium]
MWATRWGHDDSTLGCRSAYGPYFSAVVKDYSPGLVSVMPVLSATILVVSLDNIQEHREEPFFQIGENDIVINAEKFVARLDLK